ncbi:MAG: FAD:protein FMN transferase [Verrucomicrobiales bacterium]|nr:FAD:protein FMN transferase [Verrucomicrobiales bacterium]
MSHPVRARVRRSAVIREEGGLSHLTFHALGTRCSVSLVEPSREAANGFLDELLNWVADFEAKCSRFLEDSVVSRINRAAGVRWVEVDEEVSQLLDLCGHLHHLTRGAFDATSLPLLRLWDWKAQPPRIPAESEIARAKELVGWGMLQRREGAVFLPKSGMALDLGGVGKEHAVDGAVLLAERHGVTAVMVDFGQDIRALGRPPGRPAWHIGLEDPRQPGSCWASVGLCDRAVATSGDYLRHFVHEGRRYGHIIDPRDGKPVSQGALSVTAVAPTCTQAGAMTTAAFVLGPEEGFRLLSSQFGVDGVMITERGPHTTPRFYEYLVTTR